MVKKSPQVPESAGENPFPEGTHEFFHRVSQEAWLMIDRYTLSQLRETELNATEILCAALIDRQGPNVPLDYLAFHLDISLSHTRKVICTIKRVVQSRNLAPNETSPFYRALIWTGA